MAFIVSLYWLEVADDLDREGKRVLNLPLDPCRLLVSSRDRYVLGEQEVNLDVKFASTVSVAEVVELDLVAACFPFQDFSQFSVSPGIRFVHQAPDGAAHQAPSGPEDVEC